MPHRDPQAAVQAAVQSLEPRRLLHAVFISGGNLVVQGSPLADRFEFAMQGDLVKLTSYDHGQQEPADFFPAAAFKAILIYLGDGNDFVDMGDVDKPVGIDAGKGNDSLNGGRGKDTLKGGPGNDTLFGNDGDDVIVGGGGRDSMSGGTGRDLCDYQDHTLAVTAYVGGSLDSGVPGDQDTIFSNFEILRGGGGNDTLGTKVSKHVTLIGGPGDDTLSGGRGNDALDGGPGVDYLYGNAGNDTFYARDGAIDRLYGGSGTDVINQADKKDKLFEIP